MSVSSSTCVVAHRAFAMAPLAVSTLCCLIVLAGTPAVSAQPSGCAAPTAVTCSYDCQSNLVNLAWSPATTYLGVAVLVDGMPLVSLPGNATSTQHLQPAAGERIYTVNATCPGGATVQLSCAVWIAQPAAELILRLEGLDSVGNVGAIDSARDLQDALTRLGRPATVLSVPFLSYPCLTDLIGSAERVWVMAGTWPNNYPLNSAEAAALSGYATLGMDIYLESVDHWAFSHVLSGLDLRDGVETDSVLDGTDELSAMNGQAAPFLGFDLGNLLAVPYLEDRPGLNDYNDQLVVSGTSPTIPADPVTAAPMFRNHDDRGGNEGNFPITIAAVHTDGGRMISSSWEFGGFGGDTALLASHYLAFFGVPITQGVFVRGNCNPADATVNISDAIFLLGFLFPSDQDGNGTLDPNPIECQDACDANDDGNLNLGDVIALLGALFGNPSQPLATPGPTCGGDGGTADTLTCTVSPPCP